MLKKLSKLLLIMPIILMCGNALAQAPSKLNIGVVDTQAILQTSKAGKHIQGQLEAKRKEYQKQISGKEDSLRAMEKSILDQKGKLSEEEFAQKRREFEKEVVATQKMVQSNKRSLEAGFARGLAKLRDEIRETISVVAQKRGYALVMSQDAVIIAAQQMDITQEVITELDKNISKIDIDWSAK